MGRRKTNPVQKYFKYFINADTSECILYQKKLSGKHAANLERHLKGKHEKEYNAIQPEKPTLKRKRESSPSK